MSLNVATHRLHCPPYTSADFLPGSRGQGKERAVGGGQVFSGGGGEQQVVATR